MVILAKYVVALFLLKCSSHALGRRPAGFPNIPYELQQIDNSYSGIDGDGFMDATLQQTVMRYHCAWSYFHNSSLVLVHGTKAWVFPNQDVKLDLSYPVDSINAMANVLISQFDVVLRIDGTNSKGYITAGGILQESISLSFVFSNISSLEYDFRLYGVPRGAVDRFDQNNHLELC